MRSVPRPGADGEDGAEAPAFGSGEFQDVIEDPRSAWIVSVLHWFGLNLAPRFTNLQAHLKHLYCGGDVAEYRDCLIGQREESTANWSLQRRRTSIGWSPRWGSKR